VIPRLTHAAVFVRFLRFGALAWGGPVAQIDMIRQELVEEQGWITRERFNRVLAVYQALPGPEAHELCVYFGMLVRGRVGALLAGLGFMLPGFVLMMLLSWWYVAHGSATPGFMALFHGFQAAVAAVIVRAVYRIGHHAITSAWLLAIAVAGLLAHLAGVHFALTLGLAGIVHAAIRGARPPIHGAMALLPLAATPAIVQVAVPGLALLFLSGLRAGLLTFGGAYTVIPFLEHDAVGVTGWMTGDQFLDGLALASILPAPLVIFATFVGYVGGGPLGAIFLTAGVFLPAFAFTLIGHQWFERLVDNKGVHAFLDGVTAAVVGIIAATAVGLLGSAVTDIATVAIFVGSLAVLFMWRSKAAVPVVVLVSGALGLLA
jgi:chromate transporter